MPSERALVAPDEQDRGEALGLYHDLAARPWQDDTG